jgi:peptidoglycan/LPS O-acetylase OafA/YrhL
MWTLAIGGLAFVTTINYDANLNPFRWNMTQNGYYLTLSRPIFCLLLIMLYMPLFFGFGKTCKTCMTSPFMRITGRLCFAAYMICPVVIALYMSQITKVWEMTVPGFLAYALHNVVMCYFFSFLLFVLIEEPAKKVLLYFYGGKGWTGKEPLKELEMVKDYQTSAIFAKRL